MRVSFAVPSTTSATWRSATGVPSRTATTVSASCSRFSKRAEARSERWKLPSTTVPMGLSTLAALMREITWSTDSPRTCSRSGSRFTWTCRFVPPQMSTDATPSTRSRR